MLLNCTRCAAVVDALGEGRYEAFSRDDGIFFRYELWRCPSCGGPFVTEAAECGPNNEFSEAALLYPVGRRIDPAVPRSIRECFEEAEVCYRARAFTACAIMCRKAVEALGEEHGRGGQSLKESLRKMLETGQIEQRLFEWGELLRLAGNDAAHKGDATVSRDDARDLLDFTAALLEYVYSYREKIDAYRKRRQKTGANGDGY